MIGGRPVSLRKIRQTTYKMIIKNLTIINFGFRYVGNVGAFERILPLCVYYSTHKVGYILGAAVVRGFWVASQKIDATYLAAAAGLRRCFMYVHCEPLYNYPLREAHYPLSAATSWLISFYFHILHNNSSYEQVLRNNNQMVTEKLVCLN